MSTTIHVTIPDHDQALAVVATLLNQGYQISIDLDVVSDFVEPNYMSREQVEVHNKLWGNGSKTQANLKAATAKAEREARRNAKKRVAVMAEREVIARNRRVEIERAMEVECTTCGAKVFELCVTPQGKRYTTFVHVDRISHAQIARNDDASLA